MFWAKSGSLGLSRVQTYVLDPLACHLNQLKPLFSHECRGVPCSFSTCVVRESKDNWSLGVTWGSGGLLDNVDGSRSWKLARAIGGRAGNCSELLDFPHTETDISKWIWLLFTAF